MLKRNKNMVKRVKKEISPKSPLDQPLRHFSNGEIGITDKLIEKLKGQGFSKLGDLSDLSEVRLRSLGFSEVQTKKFKLFLKKIKGKMQKEKERLLPEIDQQSRILSMVSRTKPKDLALLLDLVLLLLLLLSAFYGYRKGFFAQFIPLGLIFLFLKDVQLFFVELQIMLMNFFPDKSDQAIYFLAGVLLFFGFFLIIYIVDRVFNQILRVTFFGYVDGLLGALMGALQTVLFLAVVIWLMIVNKIEVPEKYAQETFIYKTIKSFIPTCLSLIKRFFPEYATFNK
ncbi:MAG: CvpA family protein [Bacteroidota bacterium]